MGGYIFGAVLALIVIGVLWVVSVQRSLVTYDENVNNAMSQIGVQLSTRWDALTALLDLTKGYAEYEYRAITDTIKLRRTITRDSSPQEVMEQETLITDALSRIMAIAENYPDLKVNQTYIKTMDSLNLYENMVRTSRQIYNDSVTKLNRAIRMFPTNLIAGPLGFTQRDYLEAVESKANMPDMK
jgi:LemA protein